MNEWEKYRISVLEEKRRSDDDFEKYITFIASGALGLTLTFIDQISPLKESIYIWIILTGWLCLAISLFINLLSHYKSSIFNSNTIQDIDDKVSYEDLINRVNKRNRKIHILNLVSIMSLGLGILLILIFTGINAYNV